jgi:hypothetical protein
MVDVAPGRKRAAPGAARHRPRRHHAVDRAVIAQ